MSARDELATIREAHWVTDNTNLGQYRTAFKCVCGAEWVHDGHDPEQVPGPELFEQHVADAILSAGYRKPRTITTADEIRNLPALTIVVYDDMATGGPLQTYVVPDDGTVMFRECEEFHLMTFGGDYIDAKDMPLPLTVVYEVGQ